jgi:hypothetical protein
MKTMKTMKTSPSTDKDFYENKATPFTTKSTKDTKWLLRVSSQFFVCIRG